MESEKERFKKEFKNRLYKLTLDTIEFIDGLRKDNVSKRIGDQFLRSSTSVIGNYIEGQSASSRKDFTNYINISLKSANESKLWLSVLKDSGRADKVESERLLKEFIEISKILAAVMITLKGKR